jgi:hypothetical protein
VDSKIQCIHAIISENTIIIIIKDFMDYAFGPVASPGLELVNPSFSGTSYASSIYRSVVQ